MELKKLLENKPNLKENLARYILKSGVFDDLLKTGRKSAEQIVLMKLEEKIYSMNENEIIEYFDEKREFVSQILPNLSGLREFNFIIYKDGFVLYNCEKSFKKRKDATIECIKKLIELSN